MSTKKEEKNRYKERVVHKSHFIPVSVHTTEIKMSCQDGNCQDELRAEKKTEKDIEKNTSALALYVHWHPELEFFYVERGELEFFIENRTFLLKAGEGILVPPKLMHWARTQETVLFHAVVVDPLWLCPSQNVERFGRYFQPMCNGSAQYATKLTHAEVWQQEILALLTPIFFMNEEEIVAKELFIQGTLLLIWQKLYDHSLKERYPTITYHLDRLNDLQEAVSYIETHYAEDMTLEKMASQVHLSRGQFCRQFQNWTGMTPFCYLNRCRVLNSSQLLAHSSKKISEIASLCGFNSISYFNRTFLKMIGMTPSAYRKEIADAKNGDLLNPFLSF